MKQQLVLITYLLQAVHHQIGKAQPAPFQSSTCDLNTNYTFTSPYRQLLDRTLASLAANASRTGYFTAATRDQQGLSSYGLVQCRGYTSLEDCQTCANSSAAKITQLCPNQKAAAIFDESCTLQYADWNFFSTVDDFPRIGMASDKNVSNPAAFSGDLQGLLGNLSSNAAVDPSKLAVGRIRYSDSEYVYAMVQCTLDLSVSDCTDCIRVISEYAPRVFGDRTGGRLFSLSCNLRYEMYEFFRLPALQPPSPSSSPLPPLLQPDSTNFTTDDDGKKLKIRSVTLVVIPVLASVAVLAFVFAAVCYFLRVQPSSVNHGNSGEERDESLSFTLNVLKAATGDFSAENRLGEGGFGSVYKGKLHDGREIAVTRLSASSSQGHEELKTEVMLVAKLLHRNLVRLLGYCLEEEEERVLVYEYLPNGSLDKILYDPKRRFDLDWGTRYKIITGIARGLLYLHEDSQLKIVHRDLKPSNILLDEFMGPKISGFGPARLFHGSETQGDTNHVAETYGYMALEYAKHNHCSMKSDVFSFGILLLEIVTGRRNKVHTTINLQSHVWEQWRNGTGLQVKDPSMGKQCANTEVSKCIHIGLLCVQETEADRPTMSEVVMMLSSQTVTYPVPLEPAFFINRGESFGAEEEEDDDDKSSSKDEHVDFKTEEPLEVTNDASITELHPR